MRVAAAIVAIGLLIAPALRAQPEQGQRLGVDLVERPVRRSAKRGVDGDQLSDRPIGEVRGEGPVPAAYDESF